MTGESVSQSRLLVIGPSWVGDMVMAQALFSALKTKFPDSAIDVLAPAWSGPLLARMPQVSAAISMPVGHGKLGLLARWRLAQTLRARGYRRAFVLPNSFKSALIPLFAGIPVRTGWRGEMRFGLLNDIRLLDKKRYPLMVQRFVALAYADHAALPDVTPRPQLTADHGRLPELYSRLGLPGDKPVLALCPGAEFGPSKRWPARHFAAVAQEYIRRGWQVWLLGSGNDRPVADQVIASLPAASQSAASNLAGRTELVDVIDLLAVAGAVVSNDSGLMHIAAALQRPLVAVYGSSSPAFTPPLGDNVAVLSIPVDCGPCFQRECPQGHLKCLHDLPPQRVLDALATRGAADTSVVVSVVNQRPLL